MRKMKFEPRRLDFSSDEDLTALVTKKAPLSSPPKRMSERQKPHEIISDKKPTEGKEGKTSAKRSDNSSSINVKCFLDEDLVSSFIREQNLSPDIFLKGVRQRVLSRINSRFFIDHLDDFCVVKKSSYSLNIHSSKSKEFIKEIQDRFNQQLFINVSARQVIISYVAKELREIGL